jgi:lipoate-protein ligase A
MVANHDSLPLIQGYDRDDDLIAITRQAGHAQQRVRACAAVEVVIGHGSRPEQELHLEAIRQDRVPVFKRAGGGCAVVLDPGNIIVSVTLPLPGIGEIRAAFRKISAWLIQGLAASGVPGVRQRGVSDLALGDRKVGGACIWRTRALLYYSTTLLVCPDMRGIERYLQHPPREPEYRGGRPHSQFLGSLTTAAPGLDTSTLARRLREQLSLDRLWP